MYRRMSLHPFRTILTRLPGDQKKPICGQCTKANRYCDRTERLLKIRPSSLQPHAGNTPQTPCEALQDAKIARLFHHYIADLSPWYDLSDSTSSFAVAVPRVAVDECPLLFSAVIALSAMHMCKTTAAVARIHRATAELYHARCVELLIALDEGDEVLTNGVALAATCLLRSYEILDSIYAVPATQKKIEVDTNQATSTQTCTFGEPIPWCPSRTCSPRTSTAGFSPLASGTTSARTSPLASLRNVL